jgi:hypothetical protein
MTAQPMSRVPQVLLCVKTGLAFPLLGIAQVCSFVLLPILFVALMEAVVVVGPIALLE